MPPASLPVVRRTVACAFAVAFVYAIYIGGLGTILPRVGATFGLGADVQGRLFPASFGGVLVGVLTTGILSDRWGRKPVLLFALGLAALGMLLFGVAQTLTLLVIGAALIGAGGGAANLLATALIADLFPYRRAVLLNAAQIAFGAGAVCAAPLMSVLAPVGSDDWRRVFYGLSVGFALLSLLLWMLRPPQPETARQTTAGGFDLRALQSLVRSRTFALLAVSIVLYDGVEVGYSSWQPSYLAHGVIGGGPYADQVVSAFWIGMTLGRVFVGFLLTRFAPRLLRLVLSLGVTAASLLTLAFPHSPQATLVCVLATGLFAAGLFSLHLAEGSQEFPQVAGTALGLLAACAGVGAAVLPYALGLLAEHSGFRAALLAIPIASFLTALLALVPPPVRTCDVRHAK